MSTLAPGMSEGDTQYAVSAADQAAYNAWALDPTWDDYIYGAWGSMYLLTIVPSVLAMPFISVLKIGVNIYLIVDMVFKFLGLGFHPAREAYIWTMDNWWAYSFRRWFVDLLLTPMHFFTQAIPFVNWILNLITLFAYWANAMVF